MAFQRPTLPELVDRIEQDFLTRLGLVGAILRRAMVYVLSRVLAGAAHLMHGHLVYLSKQIFPDLSDADFLVRQATLFGVPPEAASFATRNVTITGTSGVIVPTGTVLVRADGATYATNADVTIVSGTATAAITAESAGAAGNVTAGTTLDFQSPIAGVNSPATVAAGGVDGVDAELPEALRVRLLLRMQEPPHGGNATDYVAWALQVTGVTRAWSYPKELGAGTVTVRCVRDNDVGSIIPDSGEVAAVQAYIDAQRPVTAAVTVVAPIDTPLAFTIHIVPDTTTTRAAVVAELTDLLFRTATPGGTLPISQIRSAVGLAADVTDYTVSVPSADVTHTTGQLATLGAITWV